MQMVQILPIMVTRFFHKVNPGLVRTVLSVIVIILVEYLVLFHVLPLTSLEVSDVFTALLLSYSPGSHSYCLY